MPSDSRIHICRGSCRCFRPRNDRARIAARILHGDRFGHPSGLRREDDGFYWMWKEGFTGVVVCGRVKGTLRIALRNSGAEQTMVRRRWANSGKLGTIVRRYAAIHHREKDRSKSFCEFIHIATRRADSFDAQRENRRCRWIACRTRAMFLRKDTRVRVRPFKLISMHREQHVYARTIRSRQALCTRAHYPSWCIVFGKRNVIYCNRPRRDCLVRRTSMNERFSTPFVSLWNCRRLIGNLSKLFLRWIRINNELKGERES